MKKTLAIVLALVMVLSCGAAFAATGWGQSSDAKTYKNFEVSLKAYEARDNGAGLSLADYKTGSAADEITGRVVIGTTVVIVAKVTVPLLKNTDLEAYDYANAKLNLTFGNLDVTVNGEAGTTSLAGASPDFYTATSQIFAICEPNVTSGATTLTPAGSASLSGYKPVTADEEYDVILPSDTITALTSSATAKAATFTYVVVGQAKKTAECPVSATFTMGQDVDKGTNYYVQFVNGDDTFRAWFGPAVVAPTATDFPAPADTATSGHKSLYIAKMNKDITDEEYGLAFNVNGSNKLSDMYFVHNDATGAIDFYAVDSCGRDGGILFNNGTDVCSHTNDVFASSMEKAFNKMLSALGWDYARGSADFGYATSKDVNGLANQVKVAAGYTFNECTELAVVDIPQTGSFAYGFAVVAMAIVAGAVVAIRKIRA